MLRSVVYARRTNQGLPDPDDLPALPCLANNAMEKEWMLAQGRRRPTATDRYSSLVAQMAAIRQKYTAATTPRARGRIARLLDLTQEEESAM